MQRATKYLKSGLSDSISVCSSCMSSPLLPLHKGTGPELLHQGGQDSNGGRVTDTVDRSARRVLTFLLTHGRGVALHHGATMAY
jgi:hypothetical protein